MWSPGPTFSFPSSPTQPFSTTNAPVHNHWVSTTQSLYFRIELRSLWSYPTFYKHTSKHDCAALCVHILVYLQTVKTTNTQEAKLALTNQNKGTRHRQMSPFPRDLDSYSPQHLVRREAIHPLVVDPTGPDPFVTWWRPSGYFPPPCLFVVPVRIGLDGRRKSNTAIFLRTLGQSLAMLVFGFRLRGGYI